VLGHRVGGDENWADRYGANRPGQRHRAGHPWLPPHCDDPGSGRVASGSSQRRGSHVRAVLRQLRPAALRSPRRPAAVGLPIRSTAKPPAGRDWPRHGRRIDPPPGDGRGRAHRPDAAESPNQCPQTTRKACNDHLAPDVWRSARQGPSLSHLSRKDYSLWGSPVVVPRPCTGARSATSYRMCTTGHSLGYKSHGGARSTGHLWYSQRGDPLRSL
jgi:hypothetical protein